IGASIGQIFFEEAKREKLATGGAENSFNQTFKKLLIIGLPVFVTLFFLIESLFVMFFGEDWRIAGVYAQIVLPLFFIRFVVGPLTLIAPLFEKQQTDLFFQGGLLFLYLGTLFLCHL
ncbi:hypothetical protein HC175_21255, partial [Salinimicrobium sp. CDJ15-91]|nr:hypothetical protein [Salinimicrobium oceani]